jgi:hydrogenase maturation factor
VPIAHLRTETGPRRVSLLCLPDPVAPGDVVLVQFGHAVAVLDPEAAAAATAEAP